MNTIYKNLPIHNYVYCDLISYGYLVSVQTLFTKDFLGIVSSQVSISEIKRAHYLGTEVSERWWHRYYRDGLFARGMGDFWMDGSGLFFRRYLTDEPIMILFSDILDVKTGKWHSGRWAGGSPVIKIVWKKGDTLLSSGFIISRDNSLVEKTVQEIRFHMQKS